MDAYRPDEQPFLKRYQEIAPGIPELLELYKPRASRNIPFALFNAFMAWQPGTRDEISGLGAYEWYERLVRSLEDAQGGIEEVVSVYAPEGQRDRIEPIDEIRGCHIPEFLLSFLTGKNPFGFVPDALAHAEIRRKLTIAAQLLLIAAADPYARVSRDLTHINFLARELFFVKVERRTVYVEYALVPETGHVARGLPVRVRLGQTVLTGPNRACLLREYSCRQVQDGAVRYYCQSDSRPKSRISAVYRQQRGSPLTDRRGMRTIVVAVEEAGALRVATRQDVLQVREIALKRLWQEPLVWEQDISPLNRFSDPRVAGAIVKILGRYHRYDGEVGESRFTAAPVEHQFLALVDDLDITHGTDMVGHVPYKRRIIRECVMPIWFSKESYGIDW